MKRQSVSGKKRLRFWDGKKEYIKRLSDVCREYKVNSIVRIPKNCLPYLPKSGLLDHFNLYSCGNKIGKRYLLCWIIEHGSYKKGEKEVQPLLDANNKYVLEVQNVVNGLNWKNVEDSMLENSFIHLRTKKTLIDEMFKRYGVSLDIDLKQIKKALLGYTRFKILDG